MDRRRFLQSMASSALALPGIVSSGEPLSYSTGLSREGLREFPASEASVEGHTLLSSFSRREEQWKVYEDLRVRDGAITFVSSAGKARVLSKTAEPVFAESGPQHLGLDLKDIGLTPEDLLTQKLLANGDPDEETVRSAAGRPSTPQIRVVPATARAGTRLWARASAATPCPCIPAAIPAPIIRCSTSPS